MKKELLGVLTEKIAKKFNLEEHSGKNIVIYDDKKIYIEKHKDEYKDEESYNNTVNNLSSIITSADFVYYNESTLGLEFFKYIDEDVLVAIRVANAKELKVRSVYPVSKTKIQNRKKKLKSIVHH
ncbi:hypothetical protein KHQ81_15575 (plasmid) [Mycoplasmatota bacterium]|nr:hypothetical protein KHQ81_15575 [Mycoplasmatota bacterium]